MIKYLPHSLSPVTKFSFIIPPNSFNFASRNTAAMSNTDILSKLETLPLNKKQEVADFIDFLVSKYTEQKRKIVRQPGSAKGMIKMSADFDEPLDDFKAYM